MALRNDGIGVDVHVHRITNRLGWHKPLTKNPEETRYAYIFVATIQELMIMHWAGSTFNPGYLKIIIGKSTTYLLDLVRCVLVP